MKDGVPLLCLVALTSASLSAQTLSIDHQPVGCVVAEKFPRLEARFVPADAIATARVVFQPESGPHWYSVAMKAEGSGFSGVLPKPRKSLKAYHYYIEATDRTLGTNRTADYTTDVVGSAARCKGKIMASALGSASVLLQVPAGAAGLPVGFASTGVVVAGSGAAASATGAAAGGGLSTPTIIVGGAAVVAGAAVAVVKSGAYGGSDKADCGAGANSLTVLERSGSTLRLQWSLEQPPASGCYTVDYLTGVGSCSAFPPHGNILPLQGTSVNLTGLTPDTQYHIHVHSLVACNGGTGAGTTNVVFVKTLPAGSGPQPTTRSDYESCCGGP